MRQRNIPQAYKRVSGPPADPPLELKVVKEHCRLPDDLTELDDQLEHYMREAEKEIESRCELSLRESSWLLTMARLPDCSRLQDFVLDKLLVRLEKPPVTGIEWVKYYDQNNVLQTADETDYELYENEQCPPILLVSDRIADLLYDGRLDAFQVQFTAGYSELPPDAVHLIKVLVAHYYRSPEAVGQAIGKGFERIDLLYNNLIETLAWRGY